MSDNTIYEPLSFYRSQIKDKVKEEATKTFDELVKKSKVDEALNKKTCKEYYSVKDSADKLNKKISLWKGFKYFLIALVVVSAIIVIFAGLYIGGGSNKDLTVSIILVSVFSVCFVASLLLIFLLINKQIKKLKLEVHSLESKADNLRKEAFNQMAVLNDLYDWNMPAKLIRKVTPLIQVDDQFDMAKYDYLHKKYSYPLITDTTQSDLDVVSGTIIGNPFVLERRLTQTMVNKTYTGTKTITWTERVRDSNGHWSTVTRSQVLTATISRPAPAYYDSTVLTYGSEACPKLHFSRTKTVPYGASEKDIEKIVKKNDKKFDKMSEEAINKGINYQKLDNAFECLFNTEDRDNDVEFRMLFTPLGQKNMVDVLTSTEGYGDDFAMIKDGPLNHIKSDHSQIFDYDADPDRFRHFDLERARNYFINYMCEFFKALYFDLAPLLSIPLYQSHKSFETIYNRDLVRNYSDHEAECLMYRYGEEYFKHPECITRSILKTNILSKNKNFDQVEVTAYGFRGEDRVEEVVQIGGDGRAHTIFVPWVEYFRVENVQRMGMGSLKNVSLNEFRQTALDSSKFNNFFKKNEQVSSRTVFRKGFYGFMLGESLLSGEPGEELSKAFIKEEAKPTTPDIDRTNK